VTRNESNVTPSVAVDEPERFPLRPTAPDAARGAASVVLNCHAAGSTDPVAHTFACNATDDEPVTDTFNEYDVFG